MCKSRIVSKQRKTVHGPKFIGERYSTVISLGKIMMERQVRSEMDICKHLKQHEYYEQKQRSEEDGGEFSKY